MARAFPTRTLPKTRRGWWLTASVWVLGCLSAFPRASADTIPAWNLLTAQTLQTATAGGGLNQSWVYAMVHGAMFDAVNAIDRRYHAYAADLKAGPGLSQDAAAAAAAHAMLAALHPQQTETVDAALAAALATVQDGPAKADGVALGKAAAEHMLARRRNDSMCSQTSYIPKNGPPALTSARYAQDFNEVKAVGAKHSTQRTAEQTAIATLREPPGTLSYNAALRALPALTQKSLVEQARVFALLNMAGSDALIVGWRAQYLHLFWRPETAIRHADSDGNEATSPDTAWEGLRSPFPAHPEYPSGHALFTGVAETVLRDFFGTDRMTVTVTNPEAQITRSFARFSEIAQSVEDARVWAGIHFRSADSDGTAMGRRIAAYALQHCMRPMAQ